MYSGVRTYVCLCVYSEVPSTCDSYCVHTVTVVMVTNRLILVCIHKYSLTCGSYCVHAVTVVMVTTYQQTCICMYSLVILNLRFVLCSYWNCVAMVTSRLQPIESCACPSPATGVGPPYLQAWPPVEDWGRQDRLEEAILHS